MTTVTDAAPIGMETGDSTGARRNQYRQENTNGSMEVTIPRSKVTRKDYDMEHENRGIALIINNIKFENRGLSDRAGSDRDAAKLYQCFLGKGFDVELLNDVKKDDIMEKLKEVAEMDHSSNDCLVCAVLSHGDKEGVWATDAKLQIEDLMNAVNSSHCKSLIFKPKIFLVQACRGTNLDSGARVRVVEDRTVSDAAGDSREYMKYLEEPEEINETIRVPNDMDFLVIHSSIDGKGSFRNTETGSPFINYFCKAMDDMSGDDDFYHVLTNMHQEMATKFSPSGSNPEFRYMKQMPCFLSMLTKSLKFKEKDY